MIESWLYEKLPDGKARCAVCALRCVIPPGGRGACGSRVNENGTLHALLHGVASSIEVDPIEKKPLFHFHPGSSVLSLGAVGCCFRCPGCQNWQISHRRPEDFERGLLRIGPEEAAERAKALGCAGIAWTYNDPVIWIEQTAPGARRAKELGLYSVYVTNGYATPEHLERIGADLTAWRFDLKGFSRKTYKRISSVARFEPVLEAARLARFRYGMYVECVTNVTPTVNDDPAELREMARWIRRELGEFTPWHVTRFFPYLDLAHLPATPVSQLERVREIGLEEGLKYVYLGNVPGHRFEDTYCHGCGRLVIERSGRSVRIGLDRGRCPHCAVEIPGRWDEPVAGKERRRETTLRYCG
jgi:pyruvate formate lyase activating enzyme